MPDPNTTTTWTDPDDAPDWLYLAEPFARLDALQVLLAPPTVRALNPELQHSLVHAGSNVPGGWPVVSGDCGCRHASDQAPLW